MNAELTIFSKSYAQVTTIDQFVYQEGEKKGRRRVGLTYFIAYLDDDTGNTILVEKTITNHTNGRHLANDISLGCIYLSRLDAEITSAALKIEQPS